MTDRTTEPARIVEADIIIEDHGILTLSVTFDYGGSMQGLGAYAVNIDFIRGFMDACGVDELHNAIGKIVTVEHEFAQVFKIIPMKFDSKNNKTFDIEKWSQSPTPKGCGLAP